MNIDCIMRELAEYIRMQEEAAAMVESLKDQLKERMTAAGVESLAGSEHKATYKAVTSSRVDTAALKMSCRRWQPVTPRPQQPEDLHLREEGTA